LSAVSATTVTLLRPPQPANALSPLWDLTLDEYIVPRKGASLPGNAAVLAQETCLQQVADYELRRIVEQMTSNCISLSIVFTTMLGALSGPAAWAAVDGTTASPSCTPLSATASRY
jgi:hypothetical protein